jgi:Na+-driven multidrug efflux pump
MLPTILLQTAIGGSVVVVVLTLIGTALTAVLSLVLAYRVIRGYRRNRSRARLSLALGLVLLTTVPILLQFVLATFTDILDVGRALATTVSELLGLVAMLYAIYGTTRQTTSRRTESEPTEQVNNE